MPFPVSILPAHPSKHTSLYGSKTRKRLPRHHVVPCRNIIRIVTSGFPRPCCCPVNTPSPELASKQVAREDTFLCRLKNRMQVALGFGRHFHRTILGIIILVFILELFRRL